MKGNVVQAAILSQERAVGVNIHGEFHISESGKRRSF
jgi:hypothetical protein